MPNYGGVKFLGTLYVVLGWLICIAGVIIFLASVMAALAASTRAETAKEATAMMAGGGLAGLFSGGVMFFGGLILIGSGQLFYCVRDMARNSFLLRPMR